MTPLMFGPPARTLTGFFHAPETAAPNRSAVLLCPPWGHEAMRSQRFFRVLADRLARSGTAVLRFDYYGTGESPGDDLEGDMHGWSEDLCAAHRELRRLTGSSCIHWLGARLGGTLALMAAHEASMNPSRVLLWDPVVDGPDYLAELRAAHVHELELSYCIPDRQLRKRLVMDPESFSDNLLGYALSPRLLAQLRSIAPVNVTVNAVHDTLVFALPEDTHVNEWVHAQHARELPVTLLPLRHALDWTSDPQPNNAMVPAEALQRLLAELRG